MQLEQRDVQPVAQCMVALLYTDTVSAQIDLFIQDLAVHIGMVAGEYHKEIKYFHQRIGASPGGHADRVGTSIDDLHHGRSDRCCW